MWYSALTAKITKYQHLKLAKNIIKYVVGSKLLKLFTTIDIKRLIG